MEFLVTELFTIITSINLFYSMIGIMILLLFTWYSRTKTERVFLSKSYALFQQILIEFFWFAAITFVSIFIFNMSLENLSPSNPLIITLGVSLSLLLFAVSNNIKGLRETKYFKYKVVRLILFFLSAIAIFYYYSYPLHGTASGINQDFNLNSNESKEVFWLLLIEESFYSSLLLIFAASAILYLPLRFSMGIILLEFWRKEFPNPSSKITVVLKNGKIIKEVYMKNNVPGNYLYLYNTEELPTQTIVINKDEIEHILFTDSNHRADETIQIENSPFP